MFTFLRNDAIINTCGNYTGTGTVFFGTGTVPVLEPCQPYSEITDPTMIFRGFSRPVIHSRSWRDLGDRRSNQDLGGIFEIIDPTKIWEDLRGH